MRSLLYILSFISCLQVFSQENHKLDSLIKNKQYLSAWNHLESIESQKNKIEVNLTKIDLCLKYFTKTVSHQAFAFNNLKENESLLNQRRIAEQKMIPIKSFKINLILDSLIHEHPKDYRLMKAQGDYYYDIFILYGKDWIKNKQEVLRRMYNGYSVAEKNGVADYISLYALGYFFNLNEQSNQAIEYFNKSLKLDSNYAPTHYNLAYLYTERDSNEAALYHAWKAYINYKYINYKNEAGQMAGSLLGKLGRHSEAISILLDCDKLIPNTYHTYYYLLNSFLALGRMHEALITAENMFYLDWKSHTINMDIVEFFVRNNHTNELIDFYNLRLQKELYDMEFRGHVYLHIAQAYDLNNNRNQTLDNVEKARDSFRICYDSGHPIFAVLNKMSSK